MGVKAAVCYGWKPYQLNVPIVFTSGSLIILEPSGFFQALTGIVLRSRFLFFFPSFLSICNLGALSVTYLHDSAHVLKTTQQPAAQCHVGDS